MIDQAPSPALRAALRCAPAALALLASACSAWGDRKDELQGVIELHERVLGFEQQGRLRELRVRRGQRVAEGEVLAALDDALQRPLRDARAEDLAAAQAQLQLLLAGTRREDVSALEAQLGSARAAERLAKHAARRAHALRKSGAVPQAHVDDTDSLLLRARSEREAVGQRLAAAKSGSRLEEVRAASARVQGAQAALALEERRLTRLVLRAPYAGVVLDTHTEPGEVLGAGAPVATLGEPRRPYVDLYVPEPRVAAIRVGSRASLRLDGVPAPFAGVVIDVGHRTEFTPRFLYSPRERPNLVVRVRVDIDDPEERLREGLPVRATIEEGQPVSRAAGETAPSALPARESP
jgi:HlyD family secretion protein